MLRKDNRRWYGGVHKPDHMKCRLTPVIDNQSTSQLTLDEHLDCFSVNT